jgi:hypothetical protein
MVGTSRRGAISRWGRRPAFSDAVERPSRSDLPRCTDGIRGRLGEPGQHPGVSPPLRRVRLVQRLRGDAKRSVFILGGFLTLIVVTTGARRRAVLALNPEASFPVEYVLLYGLVFAGVLGSTYWLASAALDRRVSHLVDQYASIPSPDLSDDQLSAAVERRARVAQLLSSGESTWTTLQTGIVILGPLITGIISAVLPEQ